MIGNIAQFGVSFEGCESDLAWSFRTCWSKLIDVGRFAVTTIDPEQALTLIDPWIELVGSASWILIHDGRKIEDESGRGIQIKHIEAMKIPLFDRLWTKRWGTRFKGGFWVYRCPVAHEMFQFIGENNIWEPEGGFVVGLDHSFGEDDSLIAQIAYGPDLCCDCLLSDAVKLLVFPMADGCGFDLYWHRKHSPIEHRVIEQLSRD